MSEETLAILLVEDDPDLREALNDILSLAGHHVLEAGDGSEALQRLAQEEVNLVLSDVRMEPMDGYSLLRQVKARHPNLPILLMTAYGTIQEAVAALQHGASDYLVKPFDARALLDKVQRFAFHARRAGNTVAVDARMKQMLRLAERVAITDASVMITGASGTGKEVMARHIHQHSSRHAGPFVAINCAAIPENLLEATLFGYEKGAFTGANQSMPGKFEQAQQGTLLLDEVTEMPLALQAKLLRVLQEREVERIGGRKGITLDVRILATSNRNLSAAVRTGAFREDLYYRLNVFPLQLPALRERPGDILPLARLALQRWVQWRGEGPTAFSPVAERLLRHHAWPGNVRELENVVQRAMILSTGKLVEEEALSLALGLSRDEDPIPPEKLDAALPFSDEAESMESALDSNLREQERVMILTALKESNGSRKQAAERLGISPRTLRYKLQRYREEGLL